MQETLAIQACEDLFRNSVCITNRENNASANVSNKAHYVWEKTDRLLFCVIHVLVAVIITPVVVAKQDMDTF